ncbi:MAG TPA: alpha/beta hydrolase [Xanthobacteraceae bacterium]|nr:alpha/beta hydrolase [Xanthobacteraceae bacterium]
MILAHRVEGPASGLPVLLIHPLGADQTFWDECRKHMGAGVRTISCDLRGSGASPDLTEPLTLDITVADLERLRRHLGLDRMVVIGCAVGAMAAVVYAARHAEHALAVIMSNPGIRVTQAGAENLRQRAELVRRSGMTALLPAAIENAFVGYATGPARSLYEARFVSQKAENYALAVLGAATSDIADDTRKIACPVLLVTGSNDRLFGREHTDEIAANIPQAAVIAFNEGAHFIPYQQPREFGVAVSAFLTQIGLLPDA